MATRVDYPPAGRALGLGGHAALISHEGQGQAFSGFPAPGEAIFLRRKAGGRRVRGREKAPESKSGKRERPAAPGFPQAGLPLPLEGGPRLGAEGVPALKASRGTPIAYYLFIFAQETRGQCLLFNIEGR